MTSAAPGLRIHVPRYNLVHDLCLHQKRTVRLEEKAETRYKLAEASPADPFFIPHLSPSPPDAPVVGVWARNVGQEGVELGCLGEGRPQPTLAWYKNNTKLSNACGG